MTHEYTLHFDNIYLCDITDYDFDKEIPITAKGYLTYIINEMPSGKKAEFIRCKIQDIIDDRKEPLESYTDSELIIWQQEIVDGFNSNDKLCLQVAKSQSDSLSEIS